MALHPSQGSASLEHRLAEILGSAPRRSPNVRVLAGYAQHIHCHLATLGFAAGVNFDRLLAKTRFQVPFGQSPFAIGRGLGFEKRLRADDYAALRRLLRALPGFPADGARVVNLRQGYPRNSTALPLRADDTLKLLEQIVRGEPDAPHLIDGAVLTATIAGRPAYFEADALAAWAQAHIHAAEVKSFPKVDERVDPDKLAAALDQVAFYILLTRDAVGRLGGDPERLVSDQALLITPKNVGMQPTLSEQRVSRRVERNRKLLDSIPEPGEVIAAVPAGLSFGPVADISADQRVRLEVLQDIAGRVGTCYESSCLATCGNAKFCRERAFRAGTPNVTGTGAIRLLPGIPTLDRAEELTRGAAPAPEETAAATLLERAGRLYDETTGKAG
ncbi:MAG: hypothetical protein JO112_21750 [Planctomycetes bacterium]|nr:hypothetical protein [Planctomycetota bacterium]